MIHPCFLYVVSLSIHHILNSFLVWMVLPKMQEDQTNQLQSGVCPFSLSSLSLNPGNIPNITTLSPNMQELQHTLACNQETGATNASKRPTSRELSSRTLLSRVSFRPSSDHQGSCSMAGGGGQELVEAYAAT